MVRSTTISVWRADHECTLVCRRLLAESALKQLDLEVAEKAYVMSRNYAGIQFVKRLKMLEVSRNGGVAHLLVQHTHVTQDF